MTAVTIDARALDAPGARYRWAQIVLHWLVVLLIAEQYMTSAAVLRTHAYRPFGKGPDPFDLTLHMAHTRLGLALFALVVLRLWLRLVWGAPAWRRSMPLWRTRLAAAVHYALYLVVLAEATAGAIASYLWWPMSVLHKTLFWALLALVALHLGGAALSFAARLRDTLPDHWNPYAIKTAARPQAGSSPMMNGYGMMGGGMWGMGLFWLLVLIILVLGVAALIKYLSN